MAPPEPRPILCGTDFSGNARLAADAAAALAARFGTRLVLAHVAFQFGLDLPTGVLPGPLLEPLRQALEREAERLRGREGIPVEVELLHGMPVAGMLADLAARCRASLVVVSSVSKTAFDRWTLGTVSESLAESAAAPTLVVRDAAPFVAWRRGERPLRIVAGLDFTAASDAVLRWAAALREKGPCEFIAVHADWPPEERTRLGLHEPLGLTGNPPEVQRVLERDLKDKVTAALGEEGVRFIIRGEWGRVDACLTETAAAERADLVVTGTHQRHGVERLRHGSVSRGVLRHARTNAASVPVGAEPVAPPGVQECRRVMAAIDLEATHAFIPPYAYGVCASGGTVRLVYVRPGAEPADAQARLRALIPPEAAERGITTEIEVVEAKDAVRALCQAAERFGAEVLCVGGHTRPGVAAQITGSVAQGVLSSSHRPILIIWPPRE